MTTYKSVNVKTELDESGLQNPKEIIWENKAYPITRIMHVSQPEDMVMAYTILICNQQRRLLYNGVEWKISSLPKALERK